VEEGKIGRLREARPHDSFSKAGACVNGEKDGGRKKRKENKGRRKRRMGRVGNFAPWYFSKFGACRRLALRIGTAWPRDRHH